MTTTTSVRYNSSPENGVCRRIRTCVGQENTYKPPSSWETTAALLQMFITNNAMNVFMGTRGRDRISLIYRPFTIEEEVTCSEEEDVSAEKGRKEQCRVCAWPEPAAQPVIVVIIFIARYISGAPTWGLMAGWSIAPGQSEGANVRNGQKFYRA